MTKIQELFKKVDLEMRADDACFTLRLLSTIPDGDCGPRAFLQSMLLEAFIQDKRDIAKNFINAICKKHSQKVSESCDEITKFYNSNIQSIDNFINTYVALKNNNLLEFEKFVSEYLPPAETNERKFDIKDDLLVFNSGSQGENVISFVGGCLLEEMKEYNTFDFSSEEDLDQFNPKAHTNMQFAFELLLNRYNINLSIYYNYCDKLSIEKYDINSIDGLNVTVYHNGDDHCCGFLTTDAYNQLNQMFKVKDPAFEQMRKLQESEAEIARKHQEETRKKDAKSFCSMEFETNDNQHENEIKVKFRSCCNIN